MICGFQGRVLSIRFDSSGNQDLDCPNGFEIGKENYAGTLVIVAVSTETTLGKSLS